MIIMESCASAINLPQSTQMSQQGNQACSTLPLLPLLFKHSTVNKSANYLPLNARTKKVLNGNQRNLWSIQVKGLRT